MRNFFFKAQKGLVLSVYVLVILVAVIAGILVWNVWGCNPPDPPAAPTSLTATAVSASQMNLAWVDNASNETGFTIERKAAGYSFAQIATVGANVTTYQNTSGLTEGTQYYYRVRACNGDGDSSYSNEANDYTFPAAPTTLTAQAISSSQINLAWIDVSTHESGYKVEQKKMPSGSWTEVATLGANAQSCQRTGLDDGTLYYFRVRAYRSSDFSAYSNEAGAITTLAAPTALQATAVSATQINLQWTDNSVSESQIKIERKEGAGGAWGQIATVGANVTTYQNTNLSPSTTYYYRVRAYNSTAGNSTYSNEASDPTFPAAPTSLTAQAVSASQINLNWSQSSPDETGFKIERKSAGEPSFAYLATVGANVTQYQDSAGLAEGMLYYYRVYAYRGSDNSAYSNEASALTILTPPSGLSGQVISGTRIDLAWSDDSTGETGFKVEIKVGAGSWTPRATLGANVEQYSATNLQEETEYYFRAFAYTSHTESTKPSVGPLTTPDQTPPAAPTGLSATASGEQQITLDWADNSEGDLAGYNVYRSNTPGSGYSKINGSPVTSSTCVDSAGLAHGATYYYVVKALDEVPNESAASAEDSEQAVDAVAPAAPTGLSASASGEQEITLDWADNGEGDLQGYNVYRSTTQGGGYAPINGSLVTSSTYVDSAGLTHGTTYYYVVKAVDEVPNVSSGSTEDSEQANDAVAPAAPTSLSASASGEQQITLDWADNGEGDLQGYNVYRSTTSGSGYTQINGSLVTASTYVDSAGLSHGVTYYYVVRAADEVPNESGNSNEDSEQAVDAVAPAAPASLRAIQSADHVTLNWDDNAESDLAGYDVYRSTDQGGPYDKLNVDPLVASTYQDTTITSGTAYYYVATAMDEVPNESAESNEANAPVPIIQSPVDGAFLNSLDAFVSGSVADLDAIATFTVNEEPTSLVDGDFATTITLAAEGPNSIEAFATDMPGDQGSRTISIIVDMTTPTVTITSPSQGAYTNASTIDIEGIVADANEITTFTLNSVVYPLVGNAFDINMALIEGENAFLAEAMDIAGNTGADGVAVIRNSTSPSIAIISPPDDYLTSATEIAVSGTLSDDIPIQSVLVNGVSVSFNANSFSGAASLTEGSNPIIAVATDVAGNQGQSASIAIVSDQSPPTIEVQAPDAVSTTTLETVFVEAHTTDTLSLVTNVWIDGQPAALNDGVSTATVALDLGLNVIEIKARDEVGNERTASVTVTRIDSLRVWFTAPENGSTVDATEVDIAGAVNDAASTITVNGAAVQRAGAAFWLNDLPIVTGPNEFVVLAVRGEETATTRTVVIDLPPDPAEVAPPLTTTVVTDITSATAFLYTGDDPIQVGMDPETIVWHRTAVLRGLVTTTTDHVTTAPLAGVKVTINNNEEYGYTITREDGMFDMVVNGGGWLTVSYEREGYMPVQRQINVPWRDWSWSEDVVMLPYDPNVTAIDLNSEEDFQIVKGSVITDGDGTRQAVLLFPKDTAVSFVMPDGSTEPYAGDKLHVRVTEYTVGDTGPAAMPAELPPATAYTYCAEFSADEAQAAGAKTVEFGGNVIGYFDNFIGFPVGSLVPQGFYDLQDGKWIAEPDGTVVEIVRFDSGYAILNTDDDPDEDNGVLLGVTAEERASLAVAYSGATTPIELWRITQSHFSPRDCNWWPSRNRDVEDKLHPNSPITGVNPDQDDPTKGPGCIIEIENQVLREDVPLAGLPFSLHYHSGRVPGRVSAYKMQIPLTGPEYPVEDVQKIFLEIEVAGRRIQRTFNPAINLSYTFTWDGKDAFGRVVQGQTPISIRIGHQVRLFYLFANVASAPSFGVPALIYGTVSLSIPSDRFSTTWFTYNETIGQMTTGSPSESGGQGLGGWWLSAHHLFDPNTRTLYFGSGEKRQTEANVTGYQLLNKNPQAGAYSSPVVSPDGDLYFIRLGSTRHIERREPDGNVETVTTNWHIAKDLAFGPDGRLYILSGYTLGGVPKPELECVVLRLEENGSFTRLIGGGYAYGYDQLDGKKGTEIKHIYNAGAIDVGADGTVYVLTNNGTTENSSRVYMLGNDGALRLVAGGGSLKGKSADGHVATQAKMNLATDLKIGPDQAIYIANSHKNKGWGVYRVGSDGIIETIAGGNEPATWSGDYEDRLAALGDGGTAIDAFLGLIGCLDFAPDGSLLISTFGYYNYNSSNAYDLPSEWVPVVQRIRRVKAARADATIQSLPRSEWSQWYQKKVAAGKEGEVYTAWTGVNPAGHGELQILNPEFPGDSLFSYSNEYRLPSLDGSLIHVFDGAGRHKWTEDAIWGDTLLEFEYNGDGMLTGVVDKYGHETEIVRDAQTGRATKIVAPFGQETLLEYDENGWLDKITAPDGGEHRFAYDVNGLMLAYAYPNAADMDDAYIHEYSEDGLYEKQENPLGGFQQFGRTDLEEGYEVAKTTSMDYRSVYGVEYLEDGTLRRTVVDEAGLESTVEESADGFLSSVGPDGMTMTAQKAPHPRFGLQVPYMSQSETKTPGGRTLRVDAEQAIEYNTPDEPSSGVKSFTARSALNGDPSDPFGTGRVSTATFSAAEGQSPARSVVESPTGRQATTLYDAEGRFWKIQAPGVPDVVYSYDADGRLETVAQGTGEDERVTAYNYDEETGLLESIDFPLDQTVRFERDAMGREVRKILPDGREIGYEYDTYGLIHTVQASGMTTHTIEYNILGVATAYVPPALDDVPNPETTYEYNADVQRTRVERADGVVMEYHYDAAGRPADITMPDSVIEFEYDATTGNLDAVHAEDYGTTVSFAYDGALPTEMRWSGVISGATQAEYDNDFRVVATSVNSTHTIAMEFDDDGLVTRVGDLEIARDAETGWVEGTVLGDVETSATYTLFGQTAAWESGIAGGAALYSTGYEYDKLGRIVSLGETIQGDSTEYEYVYDTAGRLQAVVADGDWLTSYTYDLNGNRLSRHDGATSTTTTGTYDAQDRLLSWGAATFEYNANGDLVSKSEGGDTTEYSYDPLGNLLQVVLPDDTQIDYIIDGLGRRVGKKVDGQLVQGFLYAGGLLPVAELDAEGNVVSVFGPGFMLQGGNTYRILTDHRGGPRLVVNAATAAVVQRIDYDEYGRVTRDDVSGDIQGYRPVPFGFAGGLWDRDTGLVRFGARDYDSEIGRWTTKDPIRFRGGINLYGYVLNDPLNLIDIIGCGPLPPIMPGGDYRDEDDVQDILDALYQDASEGFFDSLGNLARNHSNLYDFKNNAPDDLFFVNGRWLTAAEMGNYVAGYSAGVYDVNSMGLGLGIAGVLGAGVWYDMFDGDSTTHFDNDGSRDYIFEGYADAPVTPPGAQYYDGPGSGLLTPYPWWSPVIGP